MLSRTLLCAAALLSLAACSNNPVAPASMPTARPVAAWVSWGPETPHFNLEVVLRGDGFGHVKFRQPNDADRIIYLDVWVRDLTPNHSYLLQRATDNVIDDNCLGTNWLTLGLGPTPQAIVTDDRGTGTAALFRNLGTTAVGATFDIHFRMIDAATQVVVLTSACYQFTVSQ